ncbi:sensor histidine kinase [Pseudocolwellia sp. HL-MZ7]|uniref:sensor histidine kinase n=1 Tax=Pseudocolwellia sp. HL-MZ7 TaxID=3400627 RepID=UPI003CF3149D
MKISSKLMLIVILTIFEISLTLWSVFEISNGVKFHELNLNHFKYSSQLTHQVSALSADHNIEISELRAVVLNIRQQPIDCLDTINVVNKFIMEFIGTDNAIALCVQDIKDADHALSLINKFENETIDKDVFLSKLKTLAATFNQTSILFEEPVSKTLAFIMKVMIPLVVVISLFNILFISFMSNTITRSIRHAIKLLNHKKKKISLSDDIGQNLSGELKVLLQAAQKRITSEMLMAEVNKKLETLVEQRTESLTRANQELSQFAYRTSHDLKAPLSATKILTRFIIEDINAGQLENAVQDTQHVHDQMEKLEELVVGILSLTEADSTENKNSALDLNMILDDIQQRLSGITNLSDYTMERYINLDHVLVNNQTRITQILENLVSNALKYRDTKKSALPFVKITVSELDESHQLMIEDNGIGIPTDRHDEVFGMFKRFHPKVSFGSGLGLAIVKKHIDYLKGTINMETSDQGTKFSINIPKVIV